MAFRYSFQTIWGLVYWFCQCKCFETHMRTCSVIFLNANLALLCELSCEEKKYFSLYSCLKLSNNDKWLREQNRGLIQLNSWNYQPCINSAFVFGFGYFLIYLICFVSWTCCLFFEAGDIKLLFITNLSQVIVRCSY